MISLTAMLVAGCGKSGADVSGDQKTNDKQAAKTGADDHGDWWCSEHGVPEKECSVCSSKAAEKFKENGDWCKEHKRADSQCFIHHPDRKEFYAAEYEAKFGTPPKNRRNKDRNSQSLKS